MLQNVTLVVSRVNVINIKTRALGIPWSLLYAVVWNLADFVLNLEDVDQLCQCCRNFVQFIWWYTDWNYKVQQSTFCLVCEREEEVLAVGLFLSRYLIFCMVWCVMPIATVGPLCTFMHIFCFIVRKWQYILHSLPCLTRNSYLSFLIREVAQLRWKLVLILSNQLISKF